MALAKESKEFKGMGQTEMENEIWQNRQKLGKDICQKKLSKQCQLQNMQGQRQRKTKRNKKQANSMLNNQNQLQKKKQYRRYS